MKKYGKLIRELTDRNMFFGVTYFPNSGTHIYMLVGSRIRYVPVGVAKCLLKEAKKRERDMECKSIFGQILV